MNSNHFLRSLPLVASALGRKYGLEVIIGGDKAATNGRRIFLPSLPLDSPPELVALARGFLDHEAAHIRATNFRQIKAAKLSALEFHVFNIIEDWRVEKVLGEIFPGCRSNFDWLARHFFDKAPEPDAQLDHDLLNWLLLEARSWSVPELRPRAEALRLKLEVEVPVLIASLGPIMDEVRAACPNSQSVISFARRIVEVIKDYVNNNCGSEAESSAPGEDELSTSCDNDHSNNESENEQGTASALKSLLTKPAGELPAGLGQELEGILTAAKAAAGENHQLRVAQVCPRELGELSPLALAETNTTTLALKRRLQSLLQAATLKKIRLGHRGRLDNGQLHRVFVNDSKLFRRSGLRIGLDSAVHLLIDASGSMGGQMTFVSATAYSLCSALSKVPGLSLGATVFPGRPTRRYKERELSWETVSPILSHGQTLHHKFQLTAEGSTPMGEAVWWALQEMSPLKQNRKIILILTDGEPDYIDNTKTAIAEATRLGFEVYGLGLDSNDIKKLLPGRSAVIRQLADLPQAMFGLLGAAITGKESS
ncbi:hypothetical protein C4J81_15960 [Deltaproteobacteria bacterium Smac51]|nr:hypothetical protein C4J81_15960 [Deltaproteobacteria bacterium Smac51]